MIIKKIAISTLLGLSHQYFTASDPQKISDFFHKTSLELAQRKKQGAVIGDINQLKKRSDLLLEINEAQAVDDTPDFLANAREKIFYRHLIHHFSKESVTEFITIIESHPAETIALVENSLEESVQNYFQSRQAPKVTPQGKTLIGYLTFLRDQNDE
jgi:hypothetical protein